MRFLMLMMISVICLAASRVVGEELSKDGAVTVASIKKSADKTQSRFTAWLRALKERVAKTRARPNQLVAVAAVRGDEKDIAPKLYWKGKKSQGPVASSELDDFDKALDAALANDPGAKDKMQAFLTSYPNSAMAPDAQTVLDRLGGEAATGK